MGPGGKTLGHVMDTVKVRGHILPQLYSHSLYVIHTLLAHVTDVSLTCIGHHSWVSLLEITTSLSVFTFGRYNRSDRMVPHHSQKARCHRTIYASHEERDQCSCSCTWRALFCSGAIKARTYKPSILLYFAIIIHWHLFSLYGPDGMVEWVGRPSPILEDWRIQTYWVQPVDYDLNPLDHSIELCGFYGSIPTMSFLK